MPINRKSRRAPESEDYYDEDEKVTRRPADEDEDEERPSRKRRPSRDEDDDDEDERPRRRSRRRDEDDEEDERPRRRSSRRDDEEDDDEDEAPRRKSRRSSRDEDDEDEVEAPRKRRASRRDEEDDDEDEAPRRKSRRSGRDEDDEDEAPRRKSRRPSRDEDEDDDDPDDADDANDRSSLIQSGWGPAKKSMAANSDFTNDFRFDEEPQVVKFLSTEPMVYQQHWIERKGKRSFVCLGSKCPLCKAGDDPSGKYAWPVLNFGMEASGDQPVTQLLVCGTKLAKQLEKQDNDKRNGPLDKLYWALSKTGKQQSTSYVLEPVKERDLADDWEIDPDAAADAVDTAKVPGEEAINLTSREDLVEIARELR